MKNSNDETPIITKIEVDEKTAKPIIVEVSKKQLEKEKNSKHLDKKYDFVTKKSDKSQAKQIAMTRFLGLPEEDEKTSSRQKTFKRIISIVFIVFVLGVLAFTAYNDFFNSSEERIPFSWSTFSSLLSSSWIYLFLALLCVFLCYLFKAIKLSTLCKSLTGKAHFKTCFETGIIGLYYNNITPLAAGGQPFEIYHLVKHGISGGVAGSLPVATYVLNQSSFVIICIVCLVLGHLNPLFGRLPPAVNVLSIIGLIFVMIAVCAVLFFTLLPRASSKLLAFGVMIGTKIKIIKNPQKVKYKSMKSLIKTSKCLKQISTKKIAFTSTFLLSFFEHIANLSTAFFVLKFFGLSLSELSDSFFISWVQIFQVCIVLYLAISFVPTPGNAGAADLSFYMLFEAGLMTGLAFPAMTTWRILAFYGFIIVGFIFAYTKKKSDLKKKMQSLE